MNKDCYTQLRLVQKVDKVDRYPRLSVPRRRSHCKLQPDSSSGLSVTQNLSAAATIERMRNQHFEQRQNQVVTTSESAQDALLRLGKFLGEIFHADCCYIAASASLNICWSSDRLAIRFQQGLWNWFQSPLLKEHWVGEELLLADASALVPGGFPFRSVLALNTYHYDLFNGMICLMRAASQTPQGSPADAWKEQDMQLLKTLSTRVSVAITQAKLEQQAQQQLCYQSINDQLTAAIRTNADLTQVFDLALGRMTQAVRASRGIVLLLKEDAEVSVASEYPKACTFPEVTQSDHYICIEQDRGTWTNYSFQAAQCSLCQTLLTQPPEVLTVSALPHAEAAATAVSPLFQMEALPALLLMPIEHQGVVMGCLVLQQSELREWTVEERSFIKLVAAQLSTAIIQTRSLQHIQSIVDERTAQLQRSLEVQSKLYEKTKQQVEQLRQLDKEREEFLSTISHELLTPLTSMSLAVRMLRQATLTPDRQARYFDILEQQVQQETQLINDMLALRQLEASPTAMQIHPIDLKSLIQNAAKADADRWQKKGLTLHLDLPTPPLTLCSDPDSISRILIELLNNARKYADANSQVHLQVEQTSQPAATLLTVTSHGLGIQTQEIDHIFNKFKRGEVATQHAIQGTGLGLALVKRLVEHVGGMIAVTSQPLPSEKSWETCFTVTLPTRQKSGIGLG
jgi:signal transduction histidine kinase